MEILFNEYTELELIEHVRTVLLILRNLSFIKANEHAVRRCPKLVALVIALFVEYRDREITLNCLDIVTSIAKHIVLKEIHVGKELVATLFRTMHEAREEDLVDETMECLRRLSLSGGNEEYLEEISDKDIKLLVSLLLSENVETRECALEILCTISDRKTATKVKIASQKNCISRLVALIACGGNTIAEEKISKLAALTLANLNLAPSNKKLIMPYEEELALIAASDEKTSKVIAEILGDLDSYQVYSK